LQCPQEHTTYALLCLSFYITKLMATITQLLKSRTVIFAIALAALSVLQGYIGILPLTPIGQMYVGIAISVIVTLLRIVTTQPISEK
jgi:ABC-type branched-subunit amino acid transport system permease subunit